MENNDFIQQPIETQPEKRPDFLSILCVLSFIWSGLVLLVLLFCLLFGGLLFELMEKMLSGANGMPAIDETQEAAIQSVLKLGRGAFSAIIAFSMIMQLTSALGVFKMWRMQKWGFYIYAGINGLGLIFNFISGSFFMALMSLTFIIMYALNFKHLK